VSASCPGRKPLASQQPSTVRSKRRLSVVVPAAAAGVAAAGVVTAFCLSGPAGTAAVRPVTPKVHTAAATRTSAAAATKTKTVAAAKTATHAPKHAKLASASKPKHHAAVLTAARTVWYTVQSGDSLSAIASSYYGNASAWPVLYYANEHTLNDSETLYPGQRLRIPAKPSSIPAAPAQAASSSSSSSSSSSDASSSDASSSSSASTADTQVDASDYSGFQACVIAAESGGDSQVMNSSGHYGLYQFSYSTWVGYGGSPSEFGDATVAEQNAVFATAMADGGEDNWAPYDGC
jgi:LysM repeat protein